jgi:hypothetical protein
MLLYTEQQLEIAYNIYRMHQIGQGLGFMELENFRRLYEELWRKHMKFNAIKGLIGAVAPTIGTALGGPMGGMAANMIAEVLGVPNTPKAINTALTNATPEQMLQLKQAEQAFEVQMKELEVDVFSLEVQDKQDARGKFSKDWTARIIGVAVVGGFMGYIFLVTLQPPEQNSEALINLVLGYLGGLASAVISFYFGASNTPDK